MRGRYGEDVTFVCGYKAGCLGYLLYHQLKDYAVDCKILVPTTMAITNTSHVKTDKRDAANIARCLAFHTYSEVYVPDDEDNSVKEYIRMRDDQKLMLKKIKQQILAFVLRQGKKFEGGKTYWIIAHMKWLKNLELTGLDKETLFHSALDMSLQGICIYGKAAILSLWACLPKRTSLPYAYSYKEPFEA